VDYFGQNINVVYKPGEITPAKEAELADEREKAQSQDGDFDSNNPTEVNRLLANNAESLAERLANILVHWDVEEEDGTPVGTSKEDLMTFPNAMLSAISSAIGEDMSPKAKRPRR